MFLPTAWAPPFTVSDEAGATATLGPFEATVMVQLPVCRGMNVTISV